MKEADELLKRFYNHVTRHGKQNACGNFYSYPPGVKLLDDVDKYLKQKEVKNGDNLLE